MHDFDQCSRLDPSRSFFSPKKALNLAMSCIRYRVDEYGGPQACENEVEAREVEFPCRDCISLWFWHHPLGIKLRKGVCGYDGED
jgi:hypothetical protein